MDESLMAKKSSSAPKTRDQCIQAETKKNKEKVKFVEKGKEVKYTGAEAKEIAAKKCDKIEEEKKHEIIRGEKRARELEALKKPKPIHHEELSKKEEKIYQGKIKQFEKGRKLTSCEKIKSKKFEKEGYNEDYAILKAKEECKPKPKQPPTLSLAPEVRAKIEFSPKKEPTPSKKRKPSSAQQKKSGLALSPEIQEKSTPEKEEKEKPSTEEKSKRKLFQRKEKTPEEFEMEKKKMDLESKKIEMKMQLKSKEMELKSKVMELRMHQEQQKTAREEAQSKFLAEKLRKQDEASMEREQQRQELKKQKQAEFQEKQEQARKEEQSRKEQARKEKSAEQVKNVQKAQKPAASKRKPQKPAASNRKKSCPY